MSRLKKEEVISLLKQGKSISWVRWGIEKYSIGYDTVDSRTVQSLLKEKIITRYRNKDAPLTGCFKLTLKE